MEIYIKISQKQDVLFTAFTAHSAGCCRKLMPSEDDKLKRNVLGHRRNTIHAGNYRGHLNGEAQGT